MYDVDRLRELNSLLLVCGSDYSDVLLDAALEIERLRARVAELTIEHDRLNREVQNAYNNGYSSGFDAGKEGE